MSTIKDIPNGYVRCFATDEQCGRCATCLRSMAARVETDDLRPLTCIHPLYINKVKDGLECAYFRQERTNRMAYGFVNMFDDVPEKKARAARARMQRLYTSRMSYFRSRRGERPIPPEEQKSIALIFRQLGIEGGPKFDRYADVLDW